MNDIQRQQIKNAVDEASDALSDLAHFMNRLPGDVRNIYKDIQTTGSVSLAEFDSNGKSLAAKYEAAIGKMRAARKVLGKHFGGGR